MATKATIDKKQLTELLLQAMETELGGEQVYETALLCASNGKLHAEWTEYLEQTQDHQDVVRELIEALGGDADVESPGRSIVRAKWQGLVKAMETALATSPRIAQLVACECVVEAETKDHLNWKLISAIGDELTGDEARAVKKAVEQVEDQEDEHLYHSAGWCRELWLAELGIEAVLPPPEEQKSVKTAIGAARAEQQRDQMS